ncbi:MAG: hypothetical protein EOO36_09205 [Cytophagaceae bacterium]|nr:MAG: hypothetical protein EOO36_09205 [Cytophagaceae bacterium]
MRFLLGLLFLAATASRPALAQTTPSKTVAPGVPINSSNPTAPVSNDGTSGPGQPGTTPPVATPPGTVYSAPATKRMAPRKHPAKAAKMARP